MRQFEYPSRFILNKDEGGILINFRDFPEAITQADTLDACLSEAADCLDEAIAGRIDDGLEIPIPSVPLHDEIIVVVSKQIEK